MKIRELFEATVSSGFDPKEMIAALESVFGSKLRVVPNGGTKTMNGSLRTAHIEYNVSIQYAPNKARVKRPMPNPQLTLTGINSDIELKKLLSSPQFSNQFMITQTQALGSSLILTCLMGAKATPISMTFTVSTILQQKNKKGQGKPNDPNRKISFADIDVRPAINKVKSVLKDLSVD